MTNSYSLYDQYYRCGHCGIWISKQNDRAVYTDKRGHIIHSWCKKPVRTRPQAWISRKYRSEKNAGIKRI